MSYENYSKEQLITIIDHLEDEIDDLNERLEECDKEYRNVSVELMETSEKLQKMKTEQTGRRY